MPLCFSKTLQAVGHLLLIAYTLDLFLATYICMFTCFCADLSPVADVKPAQPWTTFEDQSHVDELFAQLGQESQCGQPLADIDRGTFQKQQQQNQLAYDAHHDLFNL